MKFVLFVLLCAVLFSALDVGVVYYTRFVNRGLLDWMHNHERQYLYLTVPAELLICTPALALKPIVGHWLMVWITTQQQQESITHAPPPSLAGFYTVQDRADGYFFVPWSIWGLWWFLWSLAWYFWIVKGFIYVFNIG